jgi:hypothetical protein
MARGNPKKEESERLPVTAQPAGDEAAGLSCPICQTQVVRGEAIVACPSCSLSYHEECWNENRGCGAYGCAQAPETVKSNVDPSRVHWEGEKRCPQCGQKIKAQATVCIHCKSQFWTRDPISREQWSKREYSGAELDRVRNVMMLVFLASACAPLFPLMIPINAHWIWGGGGLYPYVRLPASLQIMLKASFAVATLWAVILVLVLTLSH